MSTKKEKDKMQQDFTAQVEKIIPEQQNVARTGRLADAIENLFLLEKQTRQAEDYPSTSKLAVAIIRLCFEAKEWKLLNEKLQVLTKRRGQLRTVVQDFVKEGMTFLDQTPSHDIKMELLNTLRTITEGKMYVEIERARLTRILAKIREDEGKIAEAADILQEIQVETFGQMDKVEKTDFILEQMRLCLEKKDFVKTQILSNKISKKLLNDKEFEEVKVRFYLLMTKLYAGDNKYLEICKCYQSIYNTPSIAADEKQWKKYLQLVVVFACLSPHDNEQSDLLHRLKEDKNLQQLPPYKKLLDLFLTVELMKWPQIEQLYQPELNQHAIFTEKGVDGKNLKWSDLKKRVVEHNIRVIAAYYNQITSARLSQLLDLSPDDAEKFIADLVNTKSVFAKIDRSKSVISFKKRKDPNEFLNEWGADVGQLLNLVENTCHLIHRENMVHKIEVND